MPHARPPPPAPLAPLVDSSAPLPAPITSPPRAMQGEPYHMIVTIVSCFIALYAALCIITPVIGRPVAYFVYDNRPPRPMRRPPRSRSSSSRST